MTNNIGGIAFILAWFGWQVWLGRRLRGRRFAVLMIQRRLRQL